MEIGANLWQVTLSTNLKEISDLGIFFWMLSRANENAVAGHMRPVGR